MSGPRDPGDSIHTSDWERQREQLSALLDGELSATERTLLERHVAGCAQCQAELAQLRRVHVLLGAMPAPALPRSFAFPMSGAPPTTSGTGARGRTSADRVPVSALYRASRWVGGIAASLGVALLVGSGLVGVFSASPNLGMMSSVAAPAGRASYPSAAASATPGPFSIGTQGTEASNTAPPTVPPTATPITMPSKTVAPQVTSAEPPPLVPLTGAGLLAGGVIVLVGGSAARSRRRARDTT